MVSWFQGAGRSAVNPGGVGCSFPLLTDEYSIHLCVMFPNGRLALLSVIGAIAILAPSPALAGCAIAEGQMQICYKGSCEVQKLAKHCSSVLTGNSYESDHGYSYSYSQYIGGKATQMVVKFTPHDKVLYEGDPDGSPYKFDICGEDRMTGDSCTKKPWAK